MESIKFKEDEFFKKITVEFTNKLIRINNLFVKKNTINALSMFDTTTENNGEKMVGNIVRQIYLKRRGEG